MLKIKKKRRTKNLTKIFGSRVFSSVSSTFAFICLDFLLKSFSPKNIAATCFHVLRTYTFSLFFLKKNFNFLTVLPFFLFLLCTCENAICIVSIDEEKSQKSVKSRKKKRERDDNSKNDREDFL